MLSLLGKQKDGSAGSIHDAMSADKPVDEINIIKDQVTKACDLEGKKLPSIELVNQVSDFASESITKIDGGDAKTAAPRKIAQAAIVSAETQADLDEAESDFQNALNDAVPFVKQQAYTVDSINKAVKTAKDKIKNDGLLTDFDKEEKLAQIDAVSSAALDSHDNEGNGDADNTKTVDVNNAKTTNDLLLIQNSVITVCDRI